MSASLAAPTEAQGVLGALSILCNPINFSLASHSRKSLNEIRSFRIFLNFPAFERTLDFGRKPAI
jgi:hypothetical protein